ncbi:MAG: YIP1 family protein [Gemmatimonadota bacterium]
MSEEPSGHGVSGEGAGGPGEAPSAGDDPAAGYGPPPEDAPAAGYGPTGEDAPAGGETPAEGTEEAGPLPNLAVRCIQVFFSPGELFDRLKAHPVWVGILLVLIALNVIGGLLLPEEILRQLAARQLPTNADAATLERSLSVLRIGGIVGGVLFLPVLGAAIAGILAVIYNVLLGGEARYRQLFSVTLHSLLVLSVGGLLTVYLMAASGEAGAALALHLLARGLDTGTWVYRFLHGINVFGLWTAALLGIGVSRIYPRREAGGAVTLLVGLYVGLKAIVAFFPSLSGG